MAHVVRRVAVVVPELDQDPAYLSRCLGSVRSLANELRLFVASDSPVCRGPGFRKNEGAVRALQWGAACMLTIDSDDWVEPGYVDAMVGLWADTGADWVCASYQDTSGTRHTPAPRLSAAHVREHNGLSSFICISPGLLLACGGYHPSDIHEDWELNYRLLAMGYRYAVCDGHLYHYRLHDGQVTRRAGERRTRNTRALLTASRYA